MPSLIVCKHVLTATQAFGTLKESLRSNGRGPCRVKVGLPQLPTDLRRTNICIIPIHRSCNFTDLVHHLYSAPHRIGSMAPVLPSTQAAFRGPHDARLAYKNRGAWAPFSFHPHHLSHNRNFLWHNRDGRYTKSEPLSLLFAYRA